MSKSSEIINENYISNEEFKEFTAIIKRYVNLPKILMFIDKSIASEFIKKQEYGFFDHICFILHFPHGTNYYRGCIITFLGSTLLKLSSTFNNNFLQSTYFNLL